MSVAGPYAPRHPSPLRRPTKVSRPSTNYQSAIVVSRSFEQKRPFGSTVARVLTRLDQPPPPSDPYYGNKETAQLCQRFIRALFACPDRPPPSTTSPSSPTPMLAIFVAYALHRTRLHASVTFTALFLLSRLKSRFPAARGSSGHRLFISAFMIASKVVCDDTYSNKSWTVVGQGMFSLREINQMEREMCGYLEWVLNVDPKELQSFEAKVRKDYSVDGPCPAFVHPPQPVSTPGSTPVPPTSDAIGASHNQLQNPTLPVSVSEQLHLPSPPDSPRRRSTLPRALAIPPAPPMPVMIPAPIIVRPATPQLGSQDDGSPSPASSTTCLTPQSDDDEPDDATIVSTGMNSELSQDSCGPTRTSSALSMISAASLPPKSKIGRDPSFAFPSRTVW